MYHFLFAVLLAILLDVGPTLALDSQATPARFFDVIRKLEQTQHATKEQIEKITGRSLSPHAYWQFISDKNKSDIVPQLETTRSRTGQTMSVLLYANQGLQISEEQIRGTFGKKPVVRKKPKVGVDSVSFEYDYEGKLGWTNFWFEGTGKQAVVRYAEIVYRSDSKS